MFQTRDRGARATIRFPPPTALASKPYVNQYGVAGQRVRLRRLVQRGRSATYALRDGRQGELGLPDHPRRHKVGQLHHGPEQLHLQDRHGPDDGTSRRPLLRRAGNIHVQPGKVFFNGLWGFNNQVRSMLSRGSVTHTIPRHVTGRSGGGTCGPSWYATASAPGTLNVGANAYPAGQCAGVGFRSSTLPTTTSTTRGSTSSAGASISFGGYAGAGPSNLGIASRVLPANIGSAYKAGVKDYYLPTKTTLGAPRHAAPVPQTTQYLDLDPHYTDVYGDPLDQGDLRWRRRERLQPERPHNAAPGSAPDEDGRSQRDQGCWLRRAWPPPVIPPVGRVVLTARAGRGWAWTAGPRCSTSTSSPGSRATSSSRERAPSPISDNITAGTHTIGPQAYVAAEGIKEYPRAPGELRLRDLGQKMPGSKLDTLPWDIGGWVHDDASGCMRWTWPGPDGWPSGDRVERSTSG